MNRFTTLLAQSGRLARRPAWGRRREVRSARRFPTVFVANDAVLDQTVAFLESILENSPGLDLVCIPYDDNMQTICRLQRSFGFAIAPVDISAPMATLSARLYGKTVRRLVKLSCFDLFPDEFLFLDTDVVVLQDLRSLFGRVAADAAIVFADESRTQCYTRRDHTALAGSREFNTGVFLSSGRWLTTETIVAAVQNRFELYQTVGFLQNDDQCMLNFAVDMLGLPAKDFDELGLPYSSHTWFLKDNRQEINGRLIDLGSGKPVPLLHFAGQGPLGLQNAPRFSELYQHYRAQGCRRIANDASLRTGDGDTGSATAP